ncbi:cytochrome P450 [Spirillospora sp. NPDC029432]|uniref:cytochrome P450 n=1 Tax=Spirillospora sp. NPDC029432 TaxID=3154599 RepID=UPI003455A7FC
MTEIAAQYPFAPTAPAQAAENYRHVIADRPMTKVDFPFGGEGWVIHRHQAARQMLESSKFVRGPFARGERDVPFFVPFPDFLKGTLQFADPPDHTRLRRLVAKAFTARRVALLREGTQRIADELLDGMAEHGSPADLVGHFSLPLPIRVLSELLGVPAEDRDRFIEWSKSTLATSGMTQEAIIESGARLHVYMSELIAERRAEQRDDLLSALATARDKDESLTDEEILPIAMLLIIGGFDNTANFINLGVLALLRNPDQKEALLADIDAVAPTAVEEVLRHGHFAVGEKAGGLGSLVPYVATEDVEIDGTLIREGECVALDPSSVNHDPAVFEDPASFDVARERNPHLTLNHGVHHCLGAPLARMEMQVALGSLFRRFPTLKAAGEPEYASEFLTAGINAFPVSW